MKPNEPFFWIWITISILIEGAIAYLFYHWFVLSVFPHAPLIDLAQATGLLLFGYQITGTWRTQLSSILTAAEETLILFSATEYIVEGDHSTSFVDAMKQSPIARLMRYARFMALVFSWAIVLTEAWILHFFT